MQSRRLLPTLFLLTACGDDAAPGALLAFTDEPAGEACANGGTRIDAGRDLDGDGELDADEVEQTTYVCDGGDGDDGLDGDDGDDGDDGLDGDDGDDGDDVLITLTPEPHGANCANGGVRVDTGVDDSGDGVLDEPEIDSTAYLCDGEDGDAAIAGFRLIAKLTGVGGPIAEIVAASPDGTTLAYTSSVFHTVGFVDLTDPWNPVHLGDVDLADAVGHAGEGEPTSVAITPDGAYALVVVKDTANPITQADPGALVFIDLETRAVVGNIPVGVGPDSIHVTPDGTRAVIAIEDEEDAEGNSVAQSRPGTVQIVTLDLDTPASSTVRTVALAPTAGNLPTDPQPEMIDITADSATAIVSLQENNVVAVIDLEAETVTRYIEMGTSVHARADLANDKRFQLTSPFVGQLQPDGVCLIADGAMFVTANEGDTANFAFGAGIYAGGRGYSIFSVEGERVYDSGDALELAALRAGMYPDGRSANRGIEVESCAAGTFAGTEYAFLLGERNSAMAVVDVTVPSTPVIKQLLGAPMRPEGAIAIPSRNLLVVGGEGNGTGGGLWVYEGVTDLADAGNGLDVFELRSDAAPWSALGALAYDEATGLLHATPDNAFLGQRIWSFWIDHVDHRLQLVGERLLTDAAGAPLTGLDPEGLAINPEGGHVLAAEGASGNGGAGCVGSATSNRLLFVDASGALAQTVDLPCGAAPNAIDWTKVTGDGFEGVAVVDEAPGIDGGLVVYVAFQRALTGEGPHARLGVYDVDAGTWQFYFYRLDAGTTSLGELVHLGEDKFAVIERDDAWAGAATNKTVRVFRLSTGTPGAIGDPVDKATAIDLLDHDLRFDQRRLEGLALGGGCLWLTNDNEGGQAATFAVKLDPALVEVEAGPVGPTPGEDVIVINEVNSAADFVELYNQGAVAIDLGGWKLSDSDPTHVQEIVAGTSLAAGARLSIATTFPLDDADAITVSTPGGVAADTYAWASAVTSASRCVDGTGAVFLTPSAPTPGLANDCTVPGQDDIVINELNSSGTDHAELMNIGASPVDISGWRFTDNTPANVLTFAPGTVIAPGGYLAIYHDSSSLDPRMVSGLGSADAANLYTPFGILADAHSWEAHVATASRCPDGTGPFVTPRPATLGATNSCP